MRINIFHALGIRLAVPALCIAACDTFPEKDEVQPTYEVVNYFTLTNSSVLIDLFSLTDRLFSNATLTVTSAPSMGQIVSIDDRILRYEPASDFREGQDTFIVTAEDSDAILGALTVTIRVSSTRDAFPCEFIPISNQVNINGPGSISIDVLDNDHLCDTEEGTLLVSIYSQPSNGKATVNGQSIQYTVDHRIPTGDYLIYEVKTSDGISRFGWVTLTDGTIEIFPTPDNYTRGELVFVDEKTGFYSGASAIYKTINGGNTWSIVSRKYENIEFLDLQFLNAQEGIALYAPCTYGLWSNQFNLYMDCGVYFLKTSDGGNSWDEHYVTEPSYVNFAGSVFFTSSTKGFMGATVWVEDGQEVRQTILTTENGGRRWYQTFTEDFQKFGEFRISFTDNQTGYAYVAGNTSPDTLLITEDGGKNWRTFTTFHEIAAIATTSDGLFASFATDHRYSQPSGLFRFEGSGGSSQEVVKAPYKISRLGFSPSGTLCFAGGTTGHFALGLYKSIDGGLTWTVEDIGEIYGVGLETRREKNLMAITIPTENIAYILFGNKIIRYTN